VYWTVYGCWVLAALLVLAFTASSIAQNYRSHYLGLCVLVDGIIFIALMAASVDDVDKMTVRLRAWMPMAMVLVAGALPMAFPRGNARRPPE
jgi:ABC-type polysaccharide/polyol phosphate export permease